MCLFLVDLATRSEAVDWIWPKSLLQVRKYYEDFERDVED